MAEQSRYLLNDDQVPTSWYNIVPDLPAPPPPPLHPATHQPIGPDDLAPLFPMDLILHEVSQDRYVPIPDERSRSTGARISRHDGSRPSAPATIATAG